MTILVVDDEKNIRTALRDILEDEGYSVEEAEDGAKALAIMAQSPADVVLLDVKLPGRDGVSVMKEIKKQWPLTEVVMISGHSDIETAVGALRAGAYDFLEKPLSLPKVRVVLGHVTEKIRLWQQAQEAYRERFQEMIGTSAPLERIRSIIDRVAAANSTVLITGESGTGKELVAQQIHLRGPKPDAPYVQVNCAAIPHDLIESELFGHEKGSFTGASAKRVGKFEQADGGTLFLDEVGDMDVAVQAKVLRALQNGEFQRVGGNETLYATVRIVAATNKNLETEVAEGNFREDLFYRLAVVPIHVPPLRERPDDIPELARHFIARFCIENGREQLRFTPAALKRLSQMDFRGNVRELKNLVERLAIFAMDTDIDVADMDSILGAAPAVASTHFIETRPLNEAKAELEKTYIETQLELNGWDVPATAEALGILPNNLHRKITQLGIERPNNRR
jgi:two-component system, NtrC family, nitrogen regulation response regulator NtrX